MAAIDVGTNTTRLLVAEAIPQGYRDVERRLVFTRLGEGVDSTGKISSPAMKRTLGTIAEYCAVSGELGAGTIRIAGTSALRDAANRKEFLAATAQLTGVEPEVLEGEEEARLSFSGASAGLPEGSYLVCDIGGGSTELVVGEKGTGSPIGCSLDLGAVRLTERYLASDPPAPEEMLTMESAIDDALGSGGECLDRAGAGQASLVGLAGTITSLAAISLGLESYDPAVTHHHQMSLATVNQLYRQLATTPLEQRSQMPCLPAGRADIIVAGASILSRIMARWSFAGLIVSEKDILDGLVIEMLGAKFEQ